MTIGIIGAGFTGLAAGYRLAKRGHKVFIFEKEKNPGGLALGFKEKNWNWTLEQYYHHWFTNDNLILNLAKEVNQEVITIRPKTSSLVNGKVFQFDSPFTLIKFPLLSFINRIRMGFSLAIFRYNPFWSIFENYNAVQILEKLMGRKGFRLIWLPLFKNKFGKHFNEISASWFWARVRKRTSRLAYPKEGFLNFAQKIITAIKNNKGIVLLETEVIKIKQEEKIQLIVKNNSGKENLYSFDRLIITTPSFLFLKIAPQLPKRYKNEILKKQSLGAINVILRLKNKFLKDNTYWLNVCDEKSPIMAIVEHTNFIDKVNYNNEHLLYIGNYTEKESKLFKMSNQQLLNIYDPYLRKLNENYKQNVISSYIFKTPFAQPIIPNKSFILPFETPLSNVFLANMEQVYPWDRGTNYAVELGEEVAKIIENEKN
ncbi:FAD-dependent oxidoreductase [Patescibacteria group bacterium]|nr:FAD-dependent oxidoreductase [Patescibacteria group bacterium]